MPRAPIPVLAVFGHSCPQLSAEAEMANVSSIPAQAEMDWHRQALIGSDCIAVEISRLRPRALMDGRP
jgi:hypothetical protein